MPIKLDPVDYDPFEVAPDQFQYEPVDHDPFAPQHGNNVLTALGSGFKQTGGFLRTAFNVATNDAADVRESVAKTQGVPTTDAQQGFRQSIQDRIKRDGDDSVVGAIKNVAGAAYENPRGAMHETVAQLPNSGVVMGSMWAGAKLGVLATAAVPIPGARVVGAISGGILGMLFGNSAIEAGAIAGEELQDGEFDRGDILGKSLKKGGVITAVDTATMGATAAMFRPFYKAASKASQSAVAVTLRNHGLNPMDDAVVAAALKQSPELVAEVRKAGAKAAAAQMPAGFKSAGLHGTAAMLDITGEGVGEYGGSVVAGIDASLTEAVMESMMSMPQSVGQVAVGKAVAKGQDAVKKIPKLQKQNLLDSDTGFNGEDLSAPTPTNIDAATEQTPAQAEPTAPEGSQGPSAEEQQWAADIQAQRDGTYRSPGVPIQALALGAQQQRQREMERQEALEQEALRQEQEALNSPGTHINQGQDEVDRGIAEFRRLKQQEEELRRIQAIRSGQSDEAREQRAREAEEAKREEQRRQFFEREEQRIEGGTALAGWKAPEPIRRNEYAPSKAEQARRQAMFEAKARELGDIDPSPDPAIGQPIEKEIPRGLPTPAFGQPRALRGLEQDQATESSEQQPDRAMAGYQEPKTPEAKAVEKKIEQEVKKVDTAPTDGQKEAGNYRKGHIRIEGHDISIENPDGSVRSGVDNDGNAWESRMTGHYGYIKRTTGKDGDNVDVVVAPGATASPKIFVVDQVDPETFEFDEHKVMFGVDSKADAEALYLSNYDDGWEGFGGVTEMSPDEFKAWVGDKDSTTKPLYKDKTLTPPKKGEVKALQQSGDQTIDISVASDVGVAPTKPRVSKESFNKAISEQSHNENSPLNKYLFTEDTPENIEYILSGKSKHPRNLVYWQQGRLHHNSPNKSVIVLDVSKIDPSKLQTERDGVGEYLIDAKDIRGAVVGSYKNQYQLRDNFTDLVDNTPAAPDASAPSGVAPAESSQSDSRAQAINDFVESMVAPDLKRARENGIDVSQEQIDKVKNDQRARTEEFVDAIEAKDFGAMKDRLHRGNKASLKLFSAITGLSTRTQKETDENIRALDPVKYDEWVKSKKQKFDKAVADKKAADKEKAYKAMLEAQTHYDSNGKPITFEQHIKNLLDNGYTDIEITEGKFPTTKLIKHENGGKGRVLKSQIFRKKIEQEYVQKMRDQYSEKIIAEDIAREEKDRAENPDKYLSDEETEHLFTRPGAIKSLVKEPSLAQEMTDKMESMNDLIKSKGYTTRGEKGGRKTLIKDGKDVFTGTFSQVEQWIKDGEKPVESKADLKDDGTVESPSSLKDHFKKALASGRNFKNIVEARKMAREEFGVDAPAGSLEAKNIDEAMESASVEVARDIVKQGGTKAEIFDRLVDLQERMPSLNVRTSTSIKNQAYSTPLPLAYLASELAGVTGSTTVYEPSAGNGALVVGANPKNVTVNELNPDRVEFLSTQGFKDVVNTDGTVFVLGEKQDIVIGNPPFGTIKNDDGVSKEWIINPDYKTTQIDHAMVFQALKSMKDTGKAVFIIGSVNDKNKTTKGRQLLYRNPDKVRFFKTLYDNYNVVDHFSVAGKLYSKQGASWPVDFIVIDGKGKSPLTLPGAVPPQLFTSIEELKGKLNERTETLGMGSDDSTRVNGNNRGDLDTGGSHSDAGELSGTPGGKSTRVDSQGGKPEGGDRVDDGKYERPGDDVRNAAVPDKNSVGGTRIGSGKSEVPGRSGNDGNIGGSANETANQTQPSGKVGSGKRRTGDVGEQSYGSIEEELANTSEAELDSMLDDVFGKEEPPATTKTKTNKKPEVKVGQAVKKATIESLAGVQEAVKGLGALFTPKNTLGSGPVFNEETYEAARPHFEKAWEHAKEAGFTIKQLIQHLAGQFDSAIRPYLKRFLVDQQTQDKPTTKSKDSPKKKPSEKIKSTDTQTIYTPSSKSSVIGTLVPANMSRSMEKALAGIEKKYGSIDKYVADKLGYTEKEVTGTPGKFGYFSGEQVDAIALAIDNIDKGSGFIIGDQTGVGKGRVVAAMIRYSLKKGLTPIFVTEKPNLYSDMYRDLSDIGMADMADKILMTNANETVPLTSDGSKELKTKAGHNSILKKATQDGELPGDYKIVFTTYAQMNATNSPRRDFMDAMSKGSMIIMDEAHNAGGTEGAKETGDKYPRSLFFRKLVRQASSVFYSSATYAKRPGTMDLYSKTDMSLAVEDINTLGDAISAGGVPLQQVVASMLAEAGQYVRRERSFKGIAYDTTPVKIDKELSNRAAKAFAEIRYFSETFAEPAIDAAGDAGAAIGVGFTSASSAKESSITTTSFTSVMHNLVGQMLLSMKTQGAVDEAIRVFKEEGKKPVITLANTMGSFIADYASQNNLVPGDAVGLKFNDLIFNYLDKTRWYAEDAPFQKGKKEKKYIQDSELSEEALREFNRIKKLINEMDLEALPISPVDYIKAKLEEAGMTVSEITGRTDIIKYAPDGTQRLERRSAADKSINGRLKVINGFNTDVIDALVLNQSGSTGLSLHSLPKFDGHKPAPRHMIILQAEGNIDTHMQMLGRINRAGQVNSPSYSQLVGDTPAEKRPAAILAAKMASLNANTTAAADSEVTAKDSIDFINKYGDQVVAQLMQDFPDIHISLGSPLPGKSGGGLEPMGAARKVTGKIPMLPYAEQKNLYGMILSGYQDLIDQLDAMGENDLEAKTFETDAKVLKRAVVFEKSGQSPFQSEAVAEVVDMKKLGKSYTSVQVRDLLMEEVYGKDAKGQSIEQLVKDSMDKTSKTFKEALSKFEDYSTDLLDNIGDDARRQAQEAKLRGHKQDWMGVAGQLFPGKDIQVTISEMLYPATVIKVEQTGNPKNPLAMGTWKATMAVADSSRRLTFTFGKLLEGEGKIWDPAGQMTEESLEKFDQASQDAREERTIITGNMLAAYSQYKSGRIINYTTSTGKLRQGILMPRGFDLAKANKERPVIVTNADKVMKVLNDGKFMKTDGDLVVSPTNDGRITISAPASKAKGSKYFLNSQILKILGQDFVKAGNRMKVVLSDTAKVKKVVDYVLKEMNETFINTADAPRIRALLGIEADTLKDVGERNETQYSTLTNPNQPSTTTSFNKPTITLSQIKKWFKGQSVGINSDGSIWVRLQNGAGLIIRNVKQVAEGKYLLSTESGKMDQNGLIAGKYANNKIELVDGVATGKTLSHEVEHWLEDIGVITNLDKSVLDIAINTMAKKGEFDKLQDQRENRANFLSQYLADREQFRNRPIGRLLQKIADFLDAMVLLAKATVTGNTQSSVRKIARGIESGQIFSRETKAAHRGKVQNSTTLNTDTKAFQYSTVPTDQKENEKIVKSLFKQKKTFTESVKDMADKAKSEEERQLAKDKVIANTLDNLHFIKTRLGDRVYKMHRVLTGIKSATFARFLLDGSLSWVGDALQVVDKGKGVIPFLQSIGPDYQNLFLWIAARRAEQLEAEGREFWLTKDKRDAIDAKVGTHAKSGKSWESLNKRFQTINKNVLDIAEQAGLINAEGRAMWESDFYIPFYRIFENEATKAEFLSGPVAANKHISAQIRRLKGSEAKIGDLLENSMANWMHLVDASARNKAKAAAFEVGVETGIFTELTKKDLVNVLGVHNETRYAVMKPGGKQASSIFDTKEEAEAWAYTLSDKYNKEYTIEPRKNTIIKFGNMKDLGVQSFQKDGKPVYFKTDDVDLYNSMCELDAKQFSSFIMKMFGGSKRLLTKGATFGTMFRINNALRDTLHTSIVAESFVPFVDTAIGFAKSLFETKEWREMMSSGFGFGSSYIHSDDPQAGAKYVRKIIAKEGRGALSRILHSPGKILEVWEKIGTASENAARVQHYSRLRKKGMSVFDAGFESRDLMDFSMRGGGDSIQLLTRTLPFLGARIQGNYKLGRAAKKNPVRFLLKGSMLAMASLALWGAFKDDDRYKELPDWDKFLFMHFWIGDKHFRIPSPFEVGVLFCSLPVTIANIVNGNEDMKFLGEWAKTSAGDVFGIDITPQLTKPLIELTTNKNTFTGRKIVPDYMEGLPKPEQYHHYTSETAREIGKRLNVSPLQVEHLIRGYTSTMGMMALSALDDAFVRDLFDYPSRAKGEKKPWGVSRLVSDAKKPATSTKYLTGFYESAKQVADAKRTYNHYLKTTQLDKAADILKEKGLLMALSPATNKLKSKLALINDEMRRVQRSKKYTPSEKEKRLDVLMSERNRAVKAGFEGIRKAKAKQKVAG